MKHLDILCQIDPTGVVERSFGFNPDTVVQLLVGLLVVAVVSLSYVTYRTIGQQQKNLLESYKTYRDVAQTLKDLGKEIERLKDAIERIRQ